MSDRAEELAREWIQDRIRGKAGLESVLDLIRRAQMEARKPLVEALKRIQDLTHVDDGPCAACIADDAIIKLDDFIGPADAEEGK